MTLASKPSRSQVPKGAKRWEHVRTETGSDGESGQWYTWTWGGVTHIISLKILLACALRCETAHTPQTSNIGNTNTGALESTECLTVRVMRSGWSHPLPLGQATGALLLLHGGLGLHECVGRHGRDRTLLLLTTRAGGMSSSLTKAPGGIGGTALALLLAQSWRRRHRSLCRRLPLWRPRDDMYARCTAPPPRLWRSCPGTPSCHRASAAPGRAWACWVG